MIKKLWSYGYLKGVENSEMGYGITVLLEDESVKDFKGDDINKVTSEAMLYLLKLYFPTSPFTEQQNKINELKRKQ